jgi:hypothetical protein
MQPTSHSLCALGVCDLNLWQDHIQYLSVEYRSFSTLLIFVGNAT